MSKVSTLALVGAAALSFSAIAVAQQSLTQNPVSIGGMNSDSERRSFEDLLNAAYETLQSKRFHDNLNALGTEFPAIYVHFLGSGTTTDPRTAVTHSAEQLSEVVLAKPPYRYVRGPAVLVGGDEDDTATAGWTGTSEQRGSMTIGRFHLGRWQSLDAVERSCAINTVSHEMSHLVSNEPQLFMAHITDSHAATLTSKDKAGRAINPPNAVASYLVGAVAQCTWLQEHGYSPAVDLKTCVQVFGHRGFNGNRCQSFSGSREVSIRNDLPTPMVLKD
jgi:hypothetical protein